MKKYTKQGFDKALVLSLCMGLLWDCSKGDVWSVLSQVGDQRQAQQEIETRIEEGWELVWQDEFNDWGIDPNKWAIENWAAEKNNELQYYLPHNVKVENGYAKLISRKEAFGGREYTSGAIHTKDTFHFLYGKVEMKAKLPGGKGIFPAFWMMTNKDHTWLPEIDIVEMVGHEPTKAWMVMHWLNEEQEMKTVSESYKGENFTEEFHVFSVEWTPNYITWLIDGVEQFRTDKYSPSEEMYLYINTAVGGNWPGSPDESTVFPVEYEVDYVRVYQQDGGE